MPQFSAARRRAIRDEVRRDGLVVDPFLANDPDRPVFGLNLACAWPFPETWEAEYARLAANLAKLDSGGYVYPFAFTHITLVTLISFARQQAPGADLVAKWQARLPRILAALAPLIDPSASEGLRTFTLEPQPLILAKGAAFLPFANPDGAVGRLRQAVLRLLERDAALHEELVALGLNAPGIIHATLMRFLRQPADLGGFLRGFDAIADSAAFPKLEIREVVLTSETRPYMRGGQVLHHFRLRQNA